MTSLTSIDLPILLREQKELCRNILLQVSSLTDMGNLVLSSKLFASSMLEKDGINMIEQFLEVKYFSNAEDELFCVYCKRGTDINHGPYTVYDKDRKIVESGKYLNGELSGPNATYYPSGPIQSFCSGHKNGKVDGLVTYFRPNGQIKRTEKWEDGKLNGATLRWRKNGSLKAREWYKDNDLHGAYVKRDSSGNKMTKEHYFEGSLHGKSKSWWPNGVLGFRDVWVMGTKEGTSIEWDQSGTLVLSEEWRKGRKHGLSYSRFGENKYLCYFEEDVALWTMDISKGAITHTERIG